MSTTQVTHAETTHADELRRHARRDAWLRRIPLLPALAFTIVVTQVPFLFSVWYSLTEWTIVPPRPRVFIGVRNYTSLVANEFFTSAVWVSIVMTVSAVVLSVLLGTAIALLLDRSFFERC
jgi:sorbitol/mannitol transport system permease protein